MSIASLSRDRNPPIKGERNTPWWVGYNLFVLDVEVEPVMTTTARGVVLSIVALGLVIDCAMQGLSAQADQPDRFNQHDIRVFKTAACTKDRMPVEALYYIAASRSDMAAGKASPSSKLMKEEVDHNWRHIASQLTRDQVMDERFADTYHSVLSKTIPLLQQAVEKQSGVSIQVAEVNSRPMDPSKDKDVPECGQK